MHDYYDKMREHLDRHDQSRVRGLSTRDIVAKSYSNSEFRQLVTSLHERPLLTESAFWLASFIYERQEDRIPSELRCLAADAVADYVGSSTERLNVSAAEIFIVWGAHRADHRQISLRLLRHPDSSVRMAALSWVGAFLRPPDFPVLFEFRHDPDIAEIAMGGPLRYILRDHALDVLEWLTHCPVTDSGDCFEDTPDGRVSYRSWSPFLNWYETHKS